MLAINCSHHPNFFTMYTSHKRRDMSSDFQHMTLQLKVILHLRYDATQMQFALKIRDRCYQKDAQRPPSQKFVNVHVSYRWKLSANTRATLMNMTTYISHRIWWKQTRKLSVFTQHSDLSLMYCDSVWSCRWIQTFWIGKMLPSSWELKYHFIIYDVWQISLPNSRRLGHGDIIITFGMEEMSKLLHYNHIWCRENATSGVQIMVAQLLHWVWFKFTTKF
jgi:hypothetical protein